MKLFRPLLSLLLCLLLLFGVSVAASADDAPFSVTLRLGAGSIQVRAFCDGFPNNLYLSLSDLSAALSGTEKQFALGYFSNADDGDVFTITTGQPSLSRTGGTEESRPYISSLYLRRNRLFLDGRELKYYTCRYGLDLYMSLADLQLALDFCIERADDGSLLLYPGRSFSPDPFELARSGYFDAANAILLGDADTGELLYAWHGGNVYPIASLSKLMLYLLVAEAVNAGQIGLYDAVPISAAAEALSLSPDGIVEMHEGGTVPLGELLDATLVASSNEAALALAEYLSGSEEAFVEAMNRRAGELGLTTAVFRSPHGLPVYDSSALPAKQQNTMSAADLFTLCRLLLSRYPALTQRCSRQYVSLPTLDFISANSNALVFNLPGVNGLKTGNTTRAGYCLISTLPITVSSQTHTVVAIVLGAETPALRNQISQMLLRYAQRHYLESGFPAA